LWISDVHLGTRASRAIELLEFLEEVRADRIFLVGDIVDLERMRTRPLFPDVHLKVIAQLVHLANHGTDVIFVPGNHDHEFRLMAGRDICGIPVMFEADHTTPAGRRLLVTHGDILDRQIRKGTHLEKYGATAYHLLMQADVIFNRWRNMLGQDYLPISSAIKRRLRSANEYIEKFEVVATKHAREQGYDGIVCGHIHRPAIRRIGDFLYANDGDWVEHRSALAESSDGTLQILNWKLETVQADALDPVPSLAA
jgi:UDP-2,3-diacylglucosamine pyrophosphatase LpxH